MDRKWRLNREAYNTVESIIGFKEKYIKIWNEEATLASLTDVYALYTVLHIERKLWQLEYNKECQGYYFITTDDPDVMKTSILVPEGDEDVIIVQTEEEKSAKDSKETLFAGTDNVSSGTQDGIIRQILVPVSSSFNNLTPRRIHTMCSLGHTLAQQVILCLVDSNGVVTRCCLYDYIQAPLGGAGEATLTTFAANAGQ